MQVSETDIRCDVCALRIKTERNEPYLAIGKDGHVHIGSTCPEWRDSCDERARQLGWI